MLSLWGTYVKLFPALTVSSAEALTYNFYVFGSMTEFTEDFILSKE